MTQRNGIRGSSDPSLHSETSKARELANGLHHQEERGAADCERRRGSDSGDPAAVAGGAVPAPDGGWGWVVLVATILVLALTLGFPSCVGIFYTDLQNEFHASNSETSWVPSIMTSVLHAGGLGFCFSFQPAVTILGHYFVRRRAFANAMSSTGTALGLCTLPFLGNYLHTEFGWRGSFLILGAVLLNCCVCGAVMRPLQPKRRRGQPLMDRAPPPLEKETKQRGCIRTVWRFFVASLKEHMAFDQLLHNKRYCVFAIGITVMMLGFVVPLIYLVPYATAHGMEPGRAALLLSILGIVNIVVRPPFAIMFNLPWFKGRHIYVFASALLFNGLSNCICCIGAGFPVLVGYVVMYGLSMSVVGSLMFTVLMDIVAMSRFPSALGLLAVMESVTLLIGPPLAGILVDRTREYFYVFIACSAVVAFSGVFLMLSFFWLDKKESKASKQGQLPAQSEPLKAAAEASPGCEYSSLPQEGDKASAWRRGAPPASEPDHVV
uniref:Solute carrier family 16 member 5 n=1 Tax=Fundulus heteroclitus TaxID=8078 RepID=A0A3Q2SV51_FUNHE